MRLANGTVARARWHPASQSQPILTSLTGKYLASSLRWPWVLSSSCYTIRSCQRRCTCVSDTSFNVRYPSTRSARHLLAARDTNNTIYSGGFIGGWSSEDRGSGAVNLSQATIDYASSVTANGFCATLPETGVIDQQSLLCFTGRIIPKALHISFHQSVLSLLTCRRSSYR